MRSTRSRAPRLVRVVVVVGVAVAAALPVVSAGAATQAPGAGKPPAGSGMNTAAALANPLCRKDDGPYGTLDFVVQGGGPVCVAVWKQGADNGGATYQGVTKDSIDVVVLVPNDQQLAGAQPGQSPVNQATGKTGTVTNAFKDTFAAFEHQAFQTYGRKINLVFVTSTGDDETSQRADAVTVKAKKPFAVIDGTYTSEPVFGTALAAAKIPVFANTASLRIDAAAGPVPLGPDGRQRRRDERGRVHGQAARGQEGAVRRRQRNAQPDAQVRGDLRRSRHRHRPVQQDRGERTA